MQVKVDIIDSNAPALTDPNKGVTLRLRLLPVNDAQAAQLQRMLHTVVAKVVATVTEGPLSVDVNLAAAAVPVLPMPSGKPGPVTAEPADLGRGVGVAAADQQWARHGLSDRAALKFQSQGDEALYYDLLRRAQQSQKSTVPVIPMFYNADGTVNVKQMAALPAFAPAPMPTEPQVPVEEKPTDAQSSGSSAPADSGAGTQPPAGPQGDEAGNAGGTAEQASAGEGGSQQAGQTDATTEANAAEAESKSGKSA